MLRLLYFKQIKSTFFFWQTISTFFFLSQNARIEKLKLVNANKLVHRA